MPALCCAGLKMYWFFLSDLFQALDTLQHISDGSLEDIEFPRVPLEVKQEEGEDYTLPPETDLNFSSTEDFDSQLPFQETDMNDGYDENAPIKKKRLKKTYICPMCSKIFKDNYKLTRHQKVHIRSGELPEQPQTEVQCIFLLISLPKMD